MKLYKYLMALATLLLMACSQDDGIPTPQFENVDIQANIVYGSMTGGFTRSNPLDESTEFTNNDVIVVFTNGQEPTEYTFNGSSWGPEANNPLKWKQESMTFTAWYPATEGTSATNFMLPEALSVDNIAQWDYMTATAENVTRKSDVNLAFSRKMALVVINEAEIDEVFGSATINNIVLHTNSSGYKDGVVNTESGRNITMLFADNKYYAIVSPTAKNDTETFLTITLSNGETAIVKGIPALTVGSKYTYSLNVGREAVATSVSVEEWTSSTDNPLELEGGLSYTISADGGTYTVYRAHGLMAWNTAVQDNKALNLTLGADIDMQGVEGWQQVSGYTGTITGNGRTISGLNMNLSRSANAGFIAELGANGKIVNLNLAGLAVNGSATNVGGLVGENNGGTVGACSVTGAVTASSATGSVGGLVGLNSSGLVLSSYCTGNVKGGTNAVTGDIAGTNGNSGTLTGCYHSSGLIGVGTGTGNVTKVGSETGMKWVPADNNDNGAMNVMNSKMTDDFKSQLGEGFGWISNSGTDKDSRPLIIGSGARFNVHAFIKTTSINSKETYEVYTSEGLNQWNKSKSENYLSANLKLMDDIVWTDKLENGTTYTWRTHGYDTNKVNVVVDGNGKTIIGLATTGTGGYKGFIGVLGNNGVIRNLHLREVNINETGANYTGGIAGANYGNIIGCSVGGTVKSVGLDIAGIVGTNRGKIVACYNLAEIYTTCGSNFDGDDKAYGVGGIVGRNYGEITSCYNLGKVSQNPSINRYSIGAIVGSNEDSSYEVVTSYFGETTLFGIGDGTSGTTTKVADGKWSTALGVMNEAITSYGCKYIANGSDPNEPLKLVKTGN